MINSQKVQSVAAQHRWIYHHKHLFVPLVGSKSHFFANLETEINDFAPEKRAIVEFEEIEKQPRLIKGGHMKDYQVSGRCVGKFGAAKPHRRSSSMAYLFSYGCIRMVRSSTPCALLWVDFYLGVNKIGRAHV